jgi:putative membrane protein
MKNWKTRQITRILPVIALCIFAACSKDNLNKQMQETRQAEQQSLLSRKNAELPPMPDLSEGHGSDERRMYVSEQDRKYMVESVQGSLAEIATGTLAQSHAANPAVKFFAIRMVHDHAIQHFQLKAVGNFLQLPLPNNMTSEQQQELQQLAALNGDAFDRAYISMMLNDHAKTITASKFEANNGANILVRIMAAGWLPVFQDHFQHAAQVAHLLGLPVF